MLVHILQCTVQSNIAGSMYSSLSSYTYWHFGLVQPVELAMLDLNVAEMALSGVTTYSNYTEETPCDSEVSGNAGVMWTYT